MKYLILLSLTSLFFLTSCKDKCKDAGTGGTITVVAFPLHHSTPIISSDTYPDSVFVKFNTQDFPGIAASEYDFVLAGDSGEDHVHIENLKCGDYFIYMTGVDITINQRVTGGIPYHVDENAPSEIDLNVPVTE